jgi:phage repressor protein C with HTH and peptisase S24 domain
MAARRTLLTPADKAAAKRAKALWLQAKQRNPELTQEAIAARLDITQGAVSQYLNGTTAINFRTALAFANLFGCAIEDIRSDLPELKHTATLVRDADPGYAEKRAEIPIYDASFSAGDGADNSESHRIGSLLFRHSSLAKRGIDPLTAAAVYVAGESMLPRLRDGDTVVFDTRDVKPRDGKVYALTWNGDDYVKRLRFYDGRWWISSDNKADPQWRDDKPVFSDRDDFKINGRVRWVGSWED